jgi:hypothetical protein
MISLFQIEGLRHFVLVREAPSGSLDSVKDQNKGNVQSNSAIDNSNGVLTTFL